MSDQMINIVNQINRQLPDGSVWLGFEVELFRKKTLIISHQFDMYLWRDHDLIFKEVRFFNVPHKWSEYAASFDEIVRLATVEEFHAKHPDFEVKDSFVFAIDLFLGANRVEISTFFVLAKHIYYLERERPYTLDDNYIDPLQNEEFPSEKNRVPLVKLHKAEEIQRRRINKKLPD